MDQRAERVGRNEALFRRVNEQIETLNESLGSFAGSMTWVCECGDADCIEQIELTPAEYDRVRSDDALFVVKPSHELTDVESVVEANDRYSIVRKREGGPAELARELA